MHHLRGFISEENGNANNIFFLYIGKWYHILSPDQLHQYNYSFMFPIFSDGYLRSSWSGENGGVQF